ncbi:amphiregulin isoform X1 [Odocoileus virginianus]|uniref:Amphiregulin isoform X1 n=2 Tax=Odocoileus virginianus TaxID=9874 RepID=A0ABM4HFR3_ODOVR
MFAPLAPEPEPREPAPRDPEATSRSCLQRPRLAGPASSATRPPESQLSATTASSRPQLPAELPQRPQRRRSEGPMRAPLLPLAPVVLSLLIFGSAHYTVGLDVNDTYPGKGEPFSGDHSANRFEVTSKSEISSASETPPGGELSSGIDYDYSEEYDSEPQISGYVVDDSVRAPRTGEGIASDNMKTMAVEQVVKPKKNKTESEKTSDKPKRKKKGGKNGKNRRNRKKKNLCDTEFQNFCIHGKCTFLEQLETVSCQCYTEYFGERCGEKSMKTQSMVDSDLSKIALAAIAAFVSAMTFTTIAVVITILLRRRYLRGYEGVAEERKKLRQENGNAHAVA